MASQALASLTATYTDSEGEEDMDQNETPEPNAEIERASSSPTSPTSPPRPARLVSYVDDTVLSDEEVASPGKEPPPLPSGLLPPEPPGRCPRELQELVSKYYQRVLHEGLDMNKLIQDKKNFRNPSIYEKLIQFCDINELDTNYPPALYDPLRWGHQSYHDQLAKVQKTEMDRREKEKKEKIAMFSVSGATSNKRPDSDDEKRRKSKWDQAAPNASVKPSLTLPGLLQQPLTSSATGTKSTVISAFGAIAKKPRL